jgi:hypothetical protein
VSVSEFVCVCTYMSLRVRVLVYVCVQVCVSACAYAYVCVHCISGVHGVERVNFLHKGSTKGTCGCCQGGALQLCWL